jgi:hypothetical protein
VLDAALGATVLDAALGATAPDAVRGAAGSAVRRLVTSQVR